MGTLLTKIKPVIEVKNLRVTYNQGKPNEMRALDGVSLDIYPQELIVITGPSGCGKSTLMYAISGLQAPTTGVVKVNGYDIALMNGAEKTRFHSQVIGMIFQSFHLISSLRILDNVCLPQIFIGKSTAVREARGMKLLERFGIAKQAQRFPTQLSGGQMQRVAIARSLINDPAMILADEPVGNLDSKSTVNVLQILKELNDNDKKNIILVTHNIDHTQLADRVVHMRDGKIVKIVVNKEKRPVESLQRNEELKDNAEQLKKLELLMQTYSDLSLNKNDQKIIPFKAKQLLSHILYEMTLEQRSIAEAFLREYIAYDVEDTHLSERLDRSIKDGGAGWNAQRAKTFSDRAQAILAQSRALSGADPETVSQFIAYLAEIFKTAFTAQQVKCLTEIILSRLQGRIGRREVEEFLDAPARDGGVGLYKGTAKRIGYEIELMMLLRYAKDIPSDQ